MRTMLNKYSILIENSERGTQYGTEFHNNKPWKWVLETGSEEFSTWFSVEAYESDNGKVEITTYAKELGAMEREKFVYAWNKTSHAYLLI